MTFSTGYRQGSFGGAPFYTQQAQDSFGRRGAHHEFPYKDRGLWDDLGAKDVERQIEVYVTNKMSGGFTSARDALKGALDKGEGELVHPWLGRHKVVCTQYSMNQTEEELGVCRFSITFIDADTTAQPPKKNPVAGLFGKCAEALSDIAEFASSLLSFEGALDFVTSITGGRLGEFIGMVQSGVAFVDKTVGELRSFVDSALKVYGVVRNADFLLGDFINDKLGFIKDNFASMGSLKLSKELVGVISLSTPAAGDVAKAYAYLTNLSDTAASTAPWESPPRAATSRSVEQITQNLEALNFLFQAAAAVESAKLIPYLDYEHQGQAEVIKNDLLNRFNELALKADDELYRKLVGVTSSAMEIISLKAPNLAKIGHKTLLTNLPSVVLAYDLYETLDLESDLADRNGVTHPGWMPADRVLEYLNHA